MFIGDNSVKPSKCTPANNFSSPIMSLSSFSVTPSTGCIQFNNANINGRYVLVNLSLFKIFSINFIL